MNKSKPLVFFGSDDFSAPSLKALVKAGYQIAAVVSRPDSLRGRGQKLGSPAVKAIAQSAGIDVFQPQYIDGRLVAKLGELSPAVGVLVSYGKMIPEGLLSLFEHGIINAHPSLLPKYRGPSPIESAILSGDRQTGVSIIRLNQKMDSGPIYSQKVYPLTGQETRPQLHEKLSNLAAELLLACLPDILEGRLQPVAQNESLATYCRLLSKKDGIAVPENETAQEMERKVRAYLNYPKVRLSVCGHQIILVKTRPVNSKTDGPLTINCAKGTLLAIDELVAPSGRTVSGADFIRGYCRRG